MVFSCPLLINFVDRGSDYSGRVSRQLIVWQLPTYLLEIGFYFFQYFANFLWCIVHFETLCHRALRCQVVVLPVFLLAVFLAGLAMPFLSLSSLLEGGFGKASGCHGGAGVGCFRCRCRECKIFVKFCIGLLTPTRFCDRI